MYAHSLPRPLVGFLLLTVLALTGCGKKGEPLPPLRYTPVQTQDLSIHQQGNLLILRMGYPQSTTGGQALPGLGEVEIWQLEAPLADPDRPPEIDPRLFATSAEKLLALRGPELDASVTGDRIETRIPIEEPSEEPSLLAFGVRTIASTGDVSDFSNLVRLVLAPAAEPPTDIRTVATPEGVEISWSAPEWDVVGYHVYRREARERGFGEPLAQVAADSESYLDDGAQFGKRYIYTLRAIRSEDPLVESAAASESEIDYRDRFAPAPPTGVLALGEVGRVRLVWEASASADTVGYFLYRQDPGADFRQINERPITELELLDEGLTSGFSYRYRITAVDDVGNEGEPSEIVEAEVE